MQTDNLVQTIKERFDHVAAKQVIKEKYEANMLFADSGGMWNANPELIALLTTFTESDIVLVDMYGNPCRVDRNNLLIRAKERFQEQMNAWLTEFDSMSRQR